ncbi:MAG: acyl-CoA thioesterase/bile acid-CoA:amino acid N-acyltransferase family protein [Acidimicrobiales bacterium]|jgi:dienelactone hydrolase
MGQTKRCFSRGWLVATSQFAVAAIAVPALLVTPRLALSSPARQGELRLVVTPSLSLSTDPLSIRISGLRAGQRVSLIVTSVDSHGVHWKSLSTYNAGPSGTVSPASAPSGGPSYTGVDAMGPVDFTASSSKSAPFYFWGNKPLGFYFRATSGTENASVTVQRSFGVPVKITSETLAQEGFVGEYFVPSPPPGHRHAAVLVFDGSAGGMEEVLLAAALATQGYPTLDIAYFKEPGLPQALEDIPLEYFAKALRWLASRPGVDSRRIWVDGSSRGSEAALLLGVHYPGLVHGVVALVPSDAAICSYPGCAGPAWTFQGKAVPYTKQFDDPHPTDDPAAVIPVTKIQGPVFLDCGGSDQVWSSCPYAQAVMAQLAAAHDRYPHVLMVSQEGGHGSALVLPPYEPGAAESEWESEVGGSTAIANDLAWAAQWPRFVDFLQN